MGNAHSVWACANKHQSSLADGSPWCHTWKAREYKRVPGIPAFLFSRAVCLQAREVNNREQRNSVFLSVGVILHLRTYMSSASSDLERSTCSALDGCSHCDKCTLRIKEAPLMLVFFFQWVFFKCLCPVDSPAAAASRSKKREVARGFSPTFPCGPWSSLPCEPSISSISSNAWSQQC